MSDTWNGISLAEVQSARFRSISQLTFDIKRLIDSDAGVDYSFDTSSNGSVIVKNHYLTWEFIAPSDYTIQRPDTVSEMFTVLINKVTVDPVPAWEDFVDFLNDKSSTVNAFLTDGDPATIIDARGNTYPGTIHQIPTFTTFAEVVTWMRTWMSNAVLAASSQVMAESATTVYFALSAQGIAIECRFKF